MICLDTMILIYGIRSATRRREGHTFSSEHAHYSQIAERLLTEWEEESEDLALPTPAAAEYLRGPVTFEHRQREFEDLRAAFRLLPLNEASALLAAQLEQEAYDRKITPQFNVPNDARKQLVRVDAMILAIAIHNRATKLITHDAWLRELGHGRIEVLTLDDIQFQPDMFGGTEVISLGEEELHNTEDGGFRGDESKAISTGEIKGDDLKDEDDEPDSQFSRK